MVYSQVWGTGPQNALLLHCTLGASGAWRGVAGQLGDGLTMTGFDMRGHGRSKDWDGSADYHSTCTADANCFLKQPMHLIGHSFGATLALRLALERPEMVRSLTMIEPVLTSAVADTKAFDEYQLSFQPVADALQRGDHEAAAEAFSRDWGTGADWSGLPAEMRAYMATRIGFISAAEPAVNQDNAGMVTAGRLEAMDCPVLLMKGSNSPNIITEINAALLARLPNATQVTIEGASHMAPVTHSRQVATAISTFLAL